MAAGSWWSMLLSSSEMLSLLLDFGGGRGPLGFGGECRLAQHAGHSTPAPCQTRPVQIHQRTPQNDPNAQTHCVAFSQTFHLGSVWPKVARGTFRMASCRGTPSGGPRGIGSRGLSGSMRSAHARPLAGSCSELALTNTTELRRRASTVSETDGRRGGCGAAGGRLDLTNPGGGGFRGTTTPGGAMPSGHAPKQVQE